MSIFSDWLGLLWNIFLPWWPLILSLGIGLSVVSIILVPVIVLSLPEEHFVAPIPTLQHRMPWYRLWLTNLAGGTLVMAGFIMLFLPGQGLLTILVGLALCRFPAKYHLERKLMRNRTIFFAVNWIRKRYHRPPFIDPVPSGTALQTDTHHER